MKVLEQGSTIIFTSEELTVAGAIEEFHKQENYIGKAHIIVDLLVLEDSFSQEFKAWVEYADKQRRSSKSFVLISETRIDDIPDVLNVVRTLQEAKDTIELEEIERDLGI